MLSANQNDPNQRELNPDKPFEGLGLIGWCKLLFQSRATTIKQTDELVGVLVRKMDALESENRGLNRLGALAVEQYGVLLEARKFIVCEDENPMTHTGIVALIDRVNGKAVEAL